VFLKKHQLPTIESVKIPNVTTAKKINPVEMQKFDNFNEYQDNIYSATTRQLEN